MNLEIILVGIVVGIANFASRFGPFFVIQKFQQDSQKRGALWLKIALGSIGIAAISSMLVVATMQVTPICIRPTISLLPLQEENLRTLRLDRQERLTLQK